MPTRSPIRAERSPGAVRGLGLTLLDLVVPQQCAGCGADGHAWCPTCHTAALAGPPVELQGGPPGAAMAPHAGPPAHAVVAFKDGGQHRLAAPLGQLLAGSVLRVLGDHADPDDRPVWLVPVPSRAAARRRRGLDHTGVLAARAARELRRGGVAAHRLRVLRRVGATRDQVGLGRAERAVNVAGTMRADRIPAGVLVVVDDVSTTGSTLAEAARAIRASGGSQLVLAATVTAARGLPLVRAGSLRASVESVEDSARAASGGPGR
jgi:predicted amidophosphoribosyltransferase